MQTPRTVAEVVSGLYRPTVYELPKPQYTPTEKDDVRLLLDVHSMSRHMTDEGHQLSHGLVLNGYTQCGHGFNEGSTDVPYLISKYNPKTVVVQDKREWYIDNQDTKAFRDRNSRFENVEALARRSDIFKLTILKDAQQRPEWHSASAYEIGCHAWITFYHPDIVKQLAPYVRKEDCVRTHHTVDPGAVPIYSSNGRQGCVFTGAVSSAYPLRQRIVRYLSALSCEYYKHPGYHRNGSDTPAYLKTLSNFKVAICTSSMYGYSLRKIIEASAAGCTVITDLPIDDVLPMIDHNLIRIHPSISIRELESVIVRAVNDYDPEQQEHTSMLTAEYYSPISSGIRLAENIFNKRLDWINS